MVEIRDIKDRESLQAWLEGRRREDVVAIAHRAAMRVLPIYLDWVFSSEAARKGDLTAIPVLWSSLISGVVAFCPTPEITDEIKRNAAADAAADAASAYAAADAAADAASAAYAAYAYAYAASAYAADAAASAASAASAAWASLRADCAALEVGEAIEQLPLWAGAQNPLARLWQGSQALMVADPEDWSFWMKWYEAALTGTPLPCALLVKIARIKPEVWDQGPAHVNGVIAGIELEFAVKATPNAEVIVVGEDGKYASIPRSGLPSKTLEDTNERVSDVVIYIRNSQKTLTSTARSFPRLNFWRAS